VRSSVLIVRENHVWPYIGINCSILNKQLCENFKMRACARRLAATSGNGALCATRETTCAHCLHFKTGFVNLPVEMVFIVRSVREGNEFRFLCMVEGEEQWLRRDELSDEVYKVYRKERKRVSKRKEREKKRARLPSPSSPSTPQPSPPPTATTAASDGGAGDPPPRTPECSICMDAGVDTVCLPCTHAFRCRCVGGFDTCPLCSRRVEAAVRFISP